MTEVRGSDKHASLVQQGVNYYCKKFYGTGLLFLNQGSQTPRFGSKTFYPPATFPKAFSGPMVSFHAYTQVSSMYLLCPSTEMVPKNLVYKIVPTFTYAHLPILTGRLREGRQTLES
jgi:hypothetical protein